MSLETRTQRIARSAIRRVLSVKNDPSAQPWASTYRSLCRRSGSFVRTSGLVAFLAMLASEKSKSRAHSALLTHLREQWPSFYPEPTVHTAPADDDALLEQVRRSGATEYMLLTQRVLRLLMWHKRFAEALLPCRVDRDVSSREAPKREIKARRDVVNVLVGGDAYRDNVGLAFAKYLPAFDQDPAAKELLLKQYLVKGLSPRCREVYGRALATYRALFEGPNPPFKDECEVLAIQTSTRLIIGMGLKGALDFGLTFHSTYGTPLIPGSSLKGVAAAYAAQSGGEDWKKFGPQAVNLFGGSYVTDNGEERELAGLVDFLDAWYIPSPDGTSPYEMEIVNPHYGKYLAGGTRPPDGMESPIPFKFIALRAGTEFFFVIRGRDRDDRAVARQILAGALAEIGVGGKTSLGYGRFPRSVVSPAP